LTDTNINVYESNYRKDVYAPPSVVVVYKHKIDIVRGLVGCVRTQ